MAYLMSNKNIIIHDDIEQGTEDWLRLRLGKFTSSCIGDIMGRGRSSEFTQTGLNYIHSIAAERNIDDWVLDGNLSFWFERTGFSSYATNYGKENEILARGAYEDDYKVKITEVGLVERKDIPFYADSPDGLIFGDDYLGSNEFKCPYNPAIHLKFCGMKEPSDLKKIEPKYYWQCYSRLLVTGADWCDFSSFDLYQKKSLHTIRFYPDKLIFEQILERLHLANKEVEKILSIEKPQLERV